MFQKHNRNSLFNLLCLIHKEMKKVLILSKHSKPLKLIFIVVGNKLIIRLDTM